MKVFGIIVTYNGNKWIEKCLSSLQENKFAIQIVVVDNGSSDDTVSIIKEKYSNAELIELKKNFGFGAANNVGLKKAMEAKADYVLLLNQDAYLDKDTIEVLIEISLQNPDFGILSPFHFSYSKNEPEHYFREWVMKRYTPKLEDDYREGNLDDLYPTSFVHAACWFIPLSTVEKVGGFDPLFFHYGEDNDYFQRLLAKKKKAGIVPRASVFHKGVNETLKSAENNISFLVKQGLLLFKNPDASTKGALLLFMKQLVRQNLINYFSPGAKASRVNLTRIHKMLASRREQKLNQACLHK